MAQTNGAHKAQSQQPWLQRWFPHPLLTLVLVLVWMFLLNRFSAGGLLVGLFLGISIPQLTASFWPARPRIRHYGKAFNYTLLVMWDICVANVQVAGIILFRSPASLASCWVSVPLDLRSPEAITVFAGTITMTPGTVSSDLSADGRSILVHCLDAPDPEVTVRRMKQRYEARLQEIFP